MGQKVTLIGSRIESDILPVLPIDQYADFGRHILFVRHALLSRFFQGILNILQDALRFREIVILGHETTIDSGGGPLGHVRFGSGGDIRIEELVPRVLMLFLIIIEQVSVVPSSWGEGCGALRVLSIKVWGSKHLLVKRIRQLVLPHLNHAIQIAHALGLQAIEGWRAIVLEQLSILRVKVFSHAQISCERAASVG